MNRQDNTERLELVNGAIAAAATCAFPLVLTLRHMHFAWRNSLFVCALIAITLVVSAIYRFVRYDARIARLTYALALLCWVACIVGGVTLAALSWRIPVADAFLARVDQAVGFPTAALIVVVSHHPILARLLSAVYQISDTAVVAALIALTFLDRTDRVAELGFLFTTTIVLCAIIGILLPAYGTFTYLNIGLDVRRHLPPGAGVYYMPELLAYRSGAVEAINFRQLTGVITFPSFHTCMVLITCYAFRSMGWLFAAVLGFNMLVMISIIPIGGHYMTDMVGGGRLRGGDCLAHVLRRARFAENWGLQVLAVKRS